MSTPQIKVPQVMGCVIRVSQLDADGTPTVGSSVSYATDCLSKLTVTPHYEAGQEIKEQNACGSTYIDYLAPASLTRVDVALDLLAPDPNLLKMLSFASTRLTVTDGIGWALPPLGPVSGQCAIEVWALRINGGTLDATAPYAHWVMPFVQNVQFGAKEFSNTAQHTLITAEGYENENFFDGPQNDWPDQNVSDRALMWVPTTVLPDGTTGNFDTVVAS